jgi:hypothetical protein
MVVDTRAPSALPTDVLHRAERAVFAHFSRSTPSIGAVLLLI